MKLLFLFYNVDHFTMRQKADESYKVDSFAPWHDFICFNVNLNVISIGCLFVSYGGCIVLLSYQNNTRIMISQFITRVNSEALAGRQFAVPVC